MLEIVNSGATSIPEALKLVPGLIVREYTPGSYDVSIRGASQIPFQYQIVNTRNILVMVDYRSLYSTYDGGMFWSNLPIDLVDVERIEVIEGPMASLYGPNVAGGIINIITKKVEAKQVVRAITQQGLPFATNISLFIGKKLSDKLTISLSGNYSQKTRTKAEYFDFEQNKYIGADNISSLSPNPLATLVNDSIQGNYGQPHLSFRKYGINLALDYQLKNTNITFKAGKSSGLEYRPIVTSTNNLMTTQFNSNYAQLILQNNKITSYLDYTGGPYAIFKNIKGYTYQSNAVNFYMQYEFKLNYKFSVVPSISSLCILNSTKNYEYTNNITTFRLIQGNPILDVAPAIRVNYIPIDKLKIIGALRIDKFNTNFRYLPNYSLIVNYFINENNTLRFNFSNAFAGDFAVRVDASGITGGAYAPGNKNIVNFTNITPALNVKNQKYNTIELGFKSKIHPKLYFDVVAFYTEIKDIAVSSAYAKDTDTLYKNTPNQLVRHISYNTFNVIPNCHAKQLGAVLNFNINLLANKLRIKPFVMYQQNYYYNCPFYYTGAAINPTINISNARMSFSNVMDPNVVSGMAVVYEINPKLNISLNTCLYSGYQVYGFENRATTNELVMNNGVVTIDESKNGNFSKFKKNSYVPSKAIFNVKLNYKVTKVLSTFVSARNLTNNKKREWQFTDQIGGFYLLGLSYLY